MEADIMFAAMSNEDIAKYLFNHLEADDTIEVIVELKKLLGNGPHLGRGGTWQPRDGEQLVQPDH